MSKRTLEIFVEVCDQQSMSAAAQTLGMSQPAISAAVSSLEKEYDTKLFIRRGRTLQLSEQGRRLRQYADVILEQYDRAWDSLHEQHSEESYTIAMTPLASELFLPSLIRSMEDTQLSFISSESETIMNMLGEHQCDIVIADHNADDAGFTYIPLYKETFVFAASSLYIKEDSLGMNALLSKKLLLREKGAGSRQAFEAAVMKKSVQVRPFVESVSDLSLITLAQSGAGIAVLPLRLIEKSLRKKRLHTVKVKGTDLKRQYYLVYRSDMHMSEGFSALIQKIRDCAGKEDK